VVGTGFALKPSARRQTSEDGTPLLFQEDSMGSAGTLHDAFIDELRDVYNAEQQITKALPKMIKSASSPQLQKAFASHLEETKGQIARLEEVFESIEEKVRGKKCDGMAGIIEEGKAAMGEDFDEQTMDAALIASAQRVEHYEMAAYGTLVAWAEAMGHNDAAELLQTTLDEEKATDQKLSALAEGGINHRAAAAAHPEGEEEGEEEPAPMARKSARATATKSNPRR
jgi:ferritin-like metal-binding protein YciE